MVKTKKNRKKIKKYVNIYKETKVTTSMLKWYEYQQIKIKKYGCDTEYFVSAAAFFGFDL